MMVIKKLSGTGSWYVYSSVLGNNKAVYWNSSSAEDTENTIWNQTTPSSSVMTLGSSNASNENDQSYVVYLFADIQGYSKVSGSYTGNGNADGTFVYTGFKPGFFMAKRIDASDMPWVMIDNKRNSFNALSNTLLANSAEAANTGTDRADFLSQGVKIRTTSGAWNASGASFIFMAFAENPFVTSTGVPATAR
jgi:hypothetical protein